MGDAIKPMYGITRVKKVKAAAVGAMQYHNDRMPGPHSNEDIDPSRTPENRELVPHGDYADEVARRIAEGRTSTSKVRKDAVVLCEGIATASPEFFETLTPEKTREFFDDVHAFVNREFGKENVIHFTVHMDETTAHAHFGVVPLKDGTLSWKKFFDGKYALMAFQDRYYEQVGKKWGLERGERAKDTHRRHKDTQQMKRDTQRELHDLEVAVEQKRQQSMELGTEIADKEGELYEMDDAIADRELRLQGLGEQVQQETRRLESVRRSIREREMEPAPEAVSGSLRTLWKARSDGAREEQLAGEIEGLRSRVSELEGANQRARDRVEELDRELPRLRDRVRDLGIRLDHARVAVREAVAKLAEVPRGLSELAKGIARELGKAVAGEREAPAAGGGYRLADVARDMRRTGGMPGRSTTLGERDDR